MVHSMNGVFLRRFSVGGGVEYNIASHNHIWLVLTENLFKLFEVLRICYIYRHIVREQEHVHSVCNRH